ncbi:hypothetical protein Xind_00116 [Xenorhabdus indica]|nr:hypothetical protein [Xenorhabdus indica]
MLIRCLLRGMIKKIFRHRDNITRFTHPNHIVIYALGDYSLAAALHFETQ